MILDNISRALKTQNWLAAGVEFLIVIAGVVMGFQINAWNEGRQAEADAARVMTRLRAESELVVRFWISDVADALENDVHRLALLRSLDSGVIEAGAEEAVYDGLEGLYHYTAITPPSTVFEELLASGQLSRITDAASNAAVSDYADDLTFITGQLTQFRTSVDSGLAMLRGRVFSEFDPSSHTVRRYSYDIAELSQDREFVSSVVDAVRNQRVFLFFRLGALSGAVNMCEALSAAEGRRCDAAQDGRRQDAAVRAYLEAQLEAAP